MTTTVTVSVHCAKSTTAVKVITKDGDKLVSEEVLIDGEVKHFYAYDNRTISVEEIQTTTTTANA